MDAPHLLRLITGGTVLGVSTASNLLDSWSISLFNVPMTVLAMAFAGSVLSFTMDKEGDKGMPRRKLYGTIVFYTLFASASVALVPSWLEWQWFKPGMAPPLALIGAAVGRFVIPELLKMPKEILYKWFKLGQYHTGAARHRGEDDENMDDPQPPTGPPSRAKRRKP